MNSENKLEADCEGDAECELITLNVKDAGEHSLKKCINKQHRPCSIINKSECVRGVNDVTDSTPSIICNWLDTDTDGNALDTEEHICKYNNENDSVTDNMDAIFNPEFDRNISTIEDSLDTLKHVTDLNRQTYLQEPYGHADYGIYGDATFIDAGDQSSFTTTSKFINNISIDDTINFKNSYGSPLFASTKIVIDNIDLINKTISFKPEITVADLNLMWVVANPNVGLFNSIQFSNAMLDTMKINEFYETY